MHETLIAKQMVEEAKKHGEVEKIVVLAGELGHVPPKELVECLEGMVDWEIEWSEDPSVAQCDCGFKGHPTVLERGHDFYMIKCPTCGGVPKVVSGKHSKLVSVQIKD